MPAKYEEIARDLRVQIQAGTWAVDEQLPSEQELMERHQASRTPVRQAIRELRQEGLVRVAHGKGVYVAAPRVIECIDARERLSRSRRQRNESATRAEATEQGFATQSEVEVTYRAAGDFAELLGIDEADEVCVRDRVLYADGEPVMLAVSRFPRSITYGTAIEQKDSGPGGVHARLEELGYQPTYHEMTFDTRFFTAEERSLLGTDMPALVTQRFTYHGDRVLEVNEMTTPGGRYKVRIGWDAD